MSKYKKKNKKKSKKLLLLTIFFSFVDICAIICFFVMYGPWNYVRNLYVTTAMQTMTHKWMAKVFYSEEKINEIVNSNYIVGFTEDVNLDDIVIDTSNKVTYKNEEERELLEHEDGELYKMLNIKVGNANGYIVAIYDPTKVSLLRTKKFNVGGFGERVVDMCKRYGGVVCINGGGFTNGLSNGSDVPAGFVIDNGEVAWRPKDGPGIGNIIGITGDGKLKLMNNTTPENAINEGVKYGIEFGPFLIINGQKATMKGMPFGVANKCVIAQRKDGVMLFLVTEGETYVDGASLPEVVEVLEKYDAYNAANLDGGQSTSLVIDGELVNSPNYLAKKQGGRYVVTGWGLVP